MRQHQWDAAAEAYSEVRRLDPENGEIDERLARLKVARANFHFARGQKMLGQNNPFDAVGEFEQALAFQPAHPRAARSLDRARQMQTERETRAETAYEKGVSARETQRYEEALRYFAQALELDPYHRSAGLEKRSVEATLVEALIAKGDTAMVSHRYHDALTAYRKAASMAVDRHDLATRIDQAELEARAADVAAEGDRALTQERWRLAYEKFDAARRLTAQPERFTDRFTRARNSYAGEIYDTARADERAGRYECR